MAKVFSFNESAYKTKRDEFDKVLDYLETHKEKEEEFIEPIEILKKSLKFLNLTRKGLLPISYFRTAN